MPPSEDLEHEAEDLSVRDSLTEAFAEAREKPDPAAPAVPTDTAAKPAGEAAAPRADGRDAGGRFAPKVGDAAPAQAQPGAQPAPQAAQVQNGQAPATEAPRAPASWTATAKTAFSTLPPEIQAEIGRREREIEQGFAQQQQRLEVANRFDALTAPWKDRFAAEGIDPIQGVQRLFAAQSYLEKNPVQGLLFLARSYGVHPNQLAQVAGGQQQPQRAQLPPEIQALTQQVQTLQSQLTQRQQQEQAAQRQAVVSEVQSFFSDPARPYAHNVREAMAALLQGGQAKDLAEAYDKAVWANPETRQLILADQSKKAEADRLAAQRAGASGARKAAGSVVGAPAAGARPPGADTSRNSVRDDLMDALRASRA